MSGHLCQVLWTGSGTTRANRDQRLSPWAMCHTRSRETSATGSIMQLACSVGVRVSCCHLSAFLPNTWMAFVSRRWIYLVSGGLRFREDAATVENGTTKVSDWNGCRSQIASSKGNPIAWKAQWFVQRRAGNRDKKALLRSETLACTVPHCSAVTLPFTLLLLSNTLLFHFLLSPIQCAGFSLPSQPCCFHFFCLKFLRGRFYFQQFD